MSKQLDWLAEEVLDTFTGLGFDAPYIADKRDTLAGKDRLRFWCGVTTWIHNQAIRVQD
jgi:hypothetical protein